MKLLLRHRLLYIILGLFAAISLVILLIAFRYAYYDDDRAAATVLKLHWIASIACRAPADMYTVNSNDQLFELFQKYNDDHTRSADDLRIDGWGNPFVINLSATDSVKSIHISCATDRRKISDLRLTIQIEFTNGIYSVTIVRYW